MRHHTAALALLIALSGCGLEGGNSSGDSASGLTGLYEGGEGSRRNQLCLIDRDGATRFGLVVWAGAGNNSCTGKGRATRDGERLSLAMQGDETCMIEARIEAGQVTLPATLPQGCAYYCGAEVEMTGARFDKAGDGADDARRAVDLVGDPLCG
jgi:hypothetical protein